MEDIGIRFALVSAPSLGNLKLKKHQGQIMEPNAPLGRRLGELETPYSSIYPLPLGRSHWLPRCVCYGRRSVAARLRRRAASRPVVGGPHELETAGPTATTPDNDDNGC